MSDQQSRQERPRKRNWVKILLIISVSINLLIAGAVISRFVVAKRMITAHGMGAPGLMLRESRYMLREASETIATDIVSELSAILTSSWSRFNSTVN